MAKRLSYILFACGAVLLAAMAIVIATLMPKTDAAVPQPPGASGLSTAHLSPTDVVTAYIDAWNGKSIAAMEALLVKTTFDNRAIEYDVQCVDFVELHACSAVAFDARRAEAALPTEFIEKAYACELVEVSYTIYYNDKGVELYQTDSARRERFPFWLIQADASGEWLIAMQGE